MIYLMLVGFALAATTPSSSDTKMVRSTNCLSTNMVLVVTDPGRSNYIVKTTITYGSITSMAGVVSVTTNDLTNAWWWIRLSSNDLTNVMAWYRLSTNDITNMWNWVKLSSNDLTNVVSWYRLSTNDITNSWNWLQINTGNVTKATNWMVAISNCVITNLYITESASPCSFVFTDQWGYVNIRTNAGGSGGDVYTTNNNTFTKTNTFSDVIGGRSAWGAGLSVTSIIATAYGAAQHGYIFNSGSMNIGADAYGASQWGGAWNNVGKMYIESSAYGAVQHGAAIGGPWYISGVGAAQFGETVELTTSATNTGHGSIQLFYFPAAVGNQHALMTGNASLSLGNSTNTHNQCLTVGDYSFSYCDDSMSIGTGGVWTTGPIMFGGTNAGATIIIISNLVFNTFGTIVYSNVADFVSAYGGTWTASALSKEWWFEGGTVGVHIDGPSTPHVDIYNSENNVRFDPFGVTLSGNEGSWIGNGSGLTNVPLNPQTTNFVRDANNLTNKNALGGCWGFTDPVPTNILYNIQRFNPPYEITVTNVALIADGGTSVWDLVRWETYTNAVRSYTTVITGMVCTAIASNTAMSVLASNNQWVGFICTNVNASSNANPQAKW
jgi:hypothetical protein